MSADETPQQPMSPTPSWVAPPMQPGIPMMAAPQSKWPTVIGIIAIIWAAIGPGFSRYILGGMYAVYGATGTVWIILFVCPFCHL